MNSEMFPHNKKEVQLMPNKLHVSQTLLMLFHLKKLFLSVYWKTKHIEKREIM